MIKETMYLCKQDEFDEAGHTLTKSSHRAIIRNGENLLMAYVGKYGDYRFPGGKLDPGEAVHDGLAREVLEEVGAIVTSIKPVANIITKNVEKCSTNYDYFILDSYFYLCEIESTLVDTQLDEREVNDGFERKWVSIDDAITANNNVMNGPKPSLVVARETRMLNIIKEGNL